MFHLLVGRPPFEGKSAQAIVDQHLRAGLAQGSKRQGVAAAQPPVVACGFGHLHVRGVAGRFHDHAGVVGPVLVTEVKPVYTAEALRQKIQGSVFLEAVVGIDGIPTRVRVTRPLFQGLDEAAVAAAREWRFLPGRIGTTPVDVLVTIQMDFRVH